MDNERRDPRRSTVRRNYESALQSIINALDDVIVELDRQGLILFISKTLPGHSMEEIIGRDFCDWAPVHDHPAMRGAVQKVFDSGESTWYETQAAATGQTDRWYESRLTPVLRDGAVRSVILITTEITQRKLAELEAQKQAHLIQLFYNLPFAGMAITHPATRKWLKVNDKLCEILGYSREELLAHGWETFTHPDDIALSLKEIARITAGESDGYTLDKRFIHRSGGVLHTTVDVHCARSSTGEIDYLVATIQDITTRKEQEAQIRHMAHHDLLTDLPNRSLLSDRLKQNLLQAQRKGARTAVLFMDLDQFKPVNDRYGHAVGDLLLQAVAQRIQTCVRASDTVARMGGDEFVVLLAEVDGPGDALQVAQKIHGALKLPFTLTDAVVAHISSSTGIALFPEHGDSETILLRCADDAMYTAKSHGRDRVMVYAAPGDAPGGPTASG